MVAVMWVPIQKADANAKKRREVNIGLANNLTGAAFGTVATQQALQLARARMRDPNAPEPEKYSVRAARAVGRKFPKVARAAMRFKPKSAKKVMLGLGAVNVGGQLANAGLDAQSAAYFARERKNLSSKRPVGAVAKSDNGIGTFYSRDVVSKRDAWVDPEVRRQRQLSAVSTGAGLAGLASTGYGVRNFLNAPSYEQADIPVKHHYRVQDRRGGKFGAMKDMEVDVLNADKTPLRYNQHPRTIGGNIRQGIRNSRKGPNIPADATRRAAAAMRLRHAMKSKIGAPLALGAAGLGVSGAAYRLGHGKNERPWR